MSKRKGGEWRTMMAIAMLGAIAFPILRLLFDDLAVAGSGSGGLHINMIKKMQQD